MSPADLHRDDLDLRHQRRLVLLAELREAAELRARTRPRRERLERARALLHARHTRG